MSREVGCDPQGHRVSQNQGINWRSSALQILRTLCITRCESVSCSVMSNPLQLSVCFRETRVWKKRKRFSCESMAHLPVDLPVTLWPGDCVAKSQHMRALAQGGVAPSNRGHVLLSHRLSQPGIARWSLPEPQEGQAESWLLQKQRGTQINTRDC